MAWLSNYTKRILFTIAPGIAIDISDFPMKLWLDSAGSGPEIFSVVPDIHRTWIAITLADGVTQCYTEVVSWDAANKKAELYTKIPVSSAANTVLYLYYGAEVENSTFVGDTLSTPAVHVWDDNYLGVYHMNDADTSDHIHDSTINVIHGSKGETTAAPTQVDGLKGKAQSFDGGDIITMASTLSADLTGSGFATIECFFKQTVLDGAVKYIVNVRNADSLPRISLLTSITGYTMYNAQSGSEGVKTFTSTLISANSAYHAVTLVFRLFSNVVSVCVDSGTNNKSVVGFANSTFQDTTQTTIIGDVLTGVIDELRVSKIDRQVGWITLFNKSERDTAGTWGNIEELKTPSILLSLGII